MVKQSAPRKHWFRNKDVVANKKELLRLKKIWKSDLSAAKKIAELYNADSEDIESGIEWIERLPLENIKDFYDYEKGDKKDFNMQKIDRRSKLRKEHSSKIDDLDILESKINEQELEILLSKIQCMEDKLSSKKDKE